MPEQSQQRRARWSTGKQQIAFRDCLHRPLCQCLQAVYVNLSCRSLLASQLSLSACIFLCTLMCPWLAGCLPVFLSLFASLLCLSVFLYMLNNPLLTLSLKSSASIQQQKAAPTRYNTCSSLSSSSVPL